MVNSPNFSTYIYRVLKKQNPNVGITGMALACLNNIVKINIEKIMSGVNQIMIRTDKKTIGHQEIEGAVTLFFGVHIAEAINKFCNEAISKFKKSAENKGANATSKSISAGLLFPVTRIQNYMMVLSVVVRKSDKAAVFLAAMCEYLITEILELAIGTATDDKKSRISARHIMIAIQNDYELKRFYRDSVFAGGVIPNIKAEILPSKKTCKKK